ncbi:cytochrome P450 [Cyanobacterium sp. Dongsha4]|uniref:cytochrome P450 n=1 Tax=Cyanobacterium sp. DS4 TaxID=2878255 RepID=UPI002E817F64|nr:cytochrome P450 [Cyanobacterium sp. Dongsha4]WVL00170.1 cytochrome P450 [Cyanobacterium sp. Dongsha4]
MDIVERINQTNNSQELDSKLLTKAQLFNPFSPEYRENPYSIYERLRTEEPIHKSFMGGWILTRYDDIVRALQDQRFIVQTSSNLLSSQTKKNNCPFAVFSQDLLPYLDITNHNKVRPVTSKLFNQSTFNNLNDRRKQIAQIVDDLLSEIKTQGKMDIIKDLAKPLPTKVISKILGIPSADEEQVQIWSRQLTNMLELIPTSRMRQELDEGVVGFKDYMMDLIREKRNSPQSDLISSLIQYREQNDDLTENQLLANSIFLFMGGQETTSLQIGNAILALLRFPEKMRELQDNPSLIPNAVDELIRYDSATQMTGRFALENVEIGGKTIGKHQWLCLSLGSANRDPEQFPSPNELNFTRKSKHHLAFGTGIHNCLGSALARLELEIVLQKVLQEMPDMKLATQNLEWLESTFFRGLKSLPVTFTPVS